MFFSCIFTGSGIAGDKIHCSKRSIVAGRITLYSCFQAGGGDFAGWYCLVYFCACLVLCSVRYRYRYWNISSLSSSFLHSSLSSKCLAAIFQFWSLTRERPGVFFGNTYQQRCGRRKRQGKVVNRSWLSILQNAPNKRFNVNSQHYIYTQQKIKSILNSMVSFLFLIQKRKEQKYKDAIHLKTCKTPCGWTHY